MYTFKQLKALLSLKINYDLPTGAADTSLLEWLQDYAKKKHKNRIQLAYHYHRQDNHVE